MRPILALLALVGATSAQAQVVQDRYGPPRPPSPPLVVASLNVGPQGVAAPAEPYRGPMLRWASKSAAAPEPAQSAPPPAQHPAGPAYLPPSAPLPPSLFAPPAPPAKSAKPYGPEAAAAPRLAPASAVPAQPVAHAKPAQPAVQAAAKPVPAPALVQAKPVQPVVQATAQPPAQPTKLAAAPAATPRAVGAAPRFYSLHREYGMAPDHIPEQPTQPRFVLIGPPDAAKAPADGDSDDKTKASNSSAVF